MRGFVARARWPVAAALIAALAVVGLHPHGLNAVGIEGRARQRPPIYFVDVTTQANAQTRPARTWGAAWVDRDSDGDPDLIVGRHWFKPQFLGNEGGRYARLNSQALQGEGVDRHLCAWGAADHNGRPDMYCVRGANKGTGVGRNQLFIQDRKGRLREAAAEWGVTDPYGRGRSVNWIDYDSDRDLDLFVGNHARAGTTNRLFRNDGGSFTSVDAGLSDALATVASSWADWDHDGDPDLLVMQHSPGTAVAYENVGGAFVRTRLPGVTTAQWQAGAWGDYDGDGWIDLHLVSTERSVVMRNVGGRLKVVSSETLREGRMSVWFDVDNDGDLDLFVVQGARGEDFRPIPTSVNHPDLLFVNRSGRFVRVARSGFRGPYKGNGDAVTAADHDRDGRVDLLITNGYFHWKGINVLLANRSKVGNWIGVDLVGPAWDPLGIGARVIVVSAAGRRVIPTTDGVSFRSQSEVGYVHAGVGDAPGARVKVVWSDGQRDCAAAAAGTVVEVGYDSLGC